MLDAGYEELCQHHHAEDPRQVLEVVYHAMAHIARLRASSINSDR